MGKPLRDKRTSVKHVTKGLGNLLTEHKYENKFSCVSLRLDHEWQGIPVPVTEDKGKHRVGAG